jgi:hypothetical protein
MCKILRSPGINSKETIPGLLEIYKFGLTLKGKGEIRGGILESLGY